MEEDNIVAFCNTINTMSNATIAVREALKSLHNDPQSLLAKDGISLLILKQHLFVSYLRSLALLSCRRALGHSLTARTLPSRFIELDRKSRGNNAGDLVDSLVENRVILEKIQVLEGRMRYQIEKLVRIAEKQQPSAITDDPLLFKPNPQNLVDNDRENELKNSEAPAASHRGDIELTDNIYRPPRLAPVPYSEKSNKQSRRDRAPIPVALTHLASDLSLPHTENTSGLGGLPALASGRASYLKRLKDFEEENFSRVMMKKSDAKRRIRDEEDLALGGNLSGRGGSSRRRAGGLADEFNDILKSVERVQQRPGQTQGDGYEELRNKGIKKNVLERSRNQKVDDGDDQESWPRKRSRFELETKVAKKKLARQKK